jgi:hypothetical protein
MKIHFAMPEQVHAVCAGKNINVVNSNQYNASQVSRNLEAVDCLKCLKKVDEMVAAIFKSAK